MFVSSRKIQEQYSMPFIMHKFSSIFHIPLGNHNGNILYAQSKVRTIALRLCESIQLLMGNNQSPVSATSYLKHQSLNCVEQQPIFTVWMSWDQRATGWLGFLSVHLIHHIPNTYMLGKLVILNWQYAWMWVVFCPACTLHVTIWQLGQAPIWLWPWIG